VSQSVLITLSNTKSIEQFKISPPAKTPIEKKYGGQRFCQVSDAGAPGTEQLIGPKYARNSYPYIEVLKRGKRILE